MKLTRGFGKVEEAASKLGRRNANCKSCYYLMPDDEGNEECTNSNVTSFDFVKEDDREYCTYWTVGKRE